MLDWSYEPLDALLPSRPTPFTWSILGTSCEQAVRSYYAERGYNWPDGVTLLRLEAGEPQLNCVAWQAAQANTTASTRGGSLDRFLGRRRSADLSDDEVEAHFSRVDRWVSSIHRLEGGWMQADILQVMEEVEQRSRSLWNLSWRIERVAASARATLAKTLSRDDAEETVAELLAGCSEEGEGRQRLWEVAQSWPSAGNPLPGPARTLLDDFGHRSEDDLEAAYPRWRESPQTLIPTLSTHSPPCQVQTRREGVEAGVMATLGIVARRTFQQHLQQARSLTRLRGQARDKRARLVDGARAWALAAGEVATVDGRLTKPSHIFLLEIEEVKQLMTGEWHDPSQVRALVDARRHERSSRPLP